MQLAGFGSAIGALGTCESSWGRPARRGVSLFESACDRGMRAQVSRRSKSTLLGPTCEALAGCCHAVADLDTGVEASLAEATEAMLPSLKDFQKVVACVKDSRGKEEIAVLMNPRPDARSSATMISRLTREWRARDRAMKEADVQRRAKSSQHAPQTYIPGVQPLEANSTQ